LFWSVLLIILLITIFAALYFVSNIFFRLACDRDYHVGVPNKEPSDGSENQLVKFSKEINEGAKRFDNMPTELVSIKSLDGLLLSGRYLPVEGSKKTIILAHGYRSSAADFSCAWELYRELGFNLLAIDQRAHGRSEGKYITFGVKEKDDVRLWAEYVDRVYQPETIILDGISMGAATVMMAADLPMPGSVKGIIADCGFTSPWDQFEHVLKKNFRLPKFPLLYTCQMIAKIKADFDFKAVSTLDTLKRTSLPILFIHGSKDDFVPPWMSDKNYKICASEKEYVKIEGAQHGTSFLIDTEKCKKALIGFLQKL